MGLSEKLMTLFYWLRHPDQKPPVTDHIDRRLDAVEDRLITIERARNARRIVKGSR